MEAHFDGLILAKMEDRVGVEVWYVKCEEGLYDFRKKNGKS